MLKQNMFYPAVVSEKFDHVEELRGRFIQSKAFKAAKESIENGIPFLFTVDGPIAAHQDAGCILVPLPDGKIASCLFFYSDMRKTEEEATEMAEEMSSKGGEFEGGEVLVMSVGTTLAGRA